LFYSGGAVGFVRDFGRPTSQRVPCVPRAFLFFEVCRSPVRECRKFGGNTSCFPMFPTASQLTVNKREPLWVFSMFRPSPRFFAALRVSSLRLYSALFRTPDRTRFSLPFSPCPPPLRDVIFRFGEQCLFLSSLPLVTPFLTSSFLSSAILPSLARMTSIDD